MAVKADRHGSKVTIDASGFNTAMRQLAKVSGVDFKRVINHELKKILEKTVTKTKAASTKLIKERYTYKEGQKPSPRLVGRLTLNGRGRNVKSIKPTIRQGGQKKRNPDWTLLQKKLTAERKQAMSMRGLAKATWLKQARDMGFTLKVPKYVQTSYKGIGRAAAKTEAKVWKRKPYIIKVVNLARVPMVKQVGGYGAFIRAMNGRQKFFEKNLSKGVFDKTESISEKYGFEVEGLVV